ncbi:MAG TPA: ATP-binding protein [bacterium]|nr:ATP-binding protein [bacterium]
MPEGRPPSSPLVWVLPAGVGLFLSFHYLGWAGLACLAGGAGIAAAFAGWKGSPSPGVPEPTAASVPKGPEGLRDVYIPGRNFEEMLERLGSNESMLNVILNSMGEGVLLLNQADRVVLMNPTAERILGGSEKSHLGKHYLELVRHPALADLLARSKQEGLSVGEMEFSGTEERTFTVSVASVRTDREQVLGHILVFSDITSFKRLMRMRTEFVANVSHELKTPLTAILGYVETLISGALDDKKNRVQFLQKISDQAQRLNALITDVLELSRIESGMFITSLEAVDVAETAQQAVDLLKAKWEAKGIGIDLKVPPRTLVEAHREGLFHVFENLLDNAIKYSPEKSRIVIGAEERPQSKVALFVQDQGPGIPKEAQARVFERFFRVDVSRSREAGGTGLGLSIVKHLVEKMEGEVVLQSEEGKGSTFTILLAIPLD